jgi:Na+-driven multidrug efflux pump
LLNVLGNYLLFYGKWGFPVMGVEGAALSSTISRGFGFLFALYIVLFYKKTQIKVKLIHWVKWDFSTIRQVLKIGIPSSAEQLIMQTGFVLYARTVSALGTNIFAAHQIALNISGLVFSQACPSVSQQQHLLESVSERVCPIRWNAMPRRSEDLPIL